MTDPFPVVYTRRKIRQIEQHGAFMGKSNEKKQRDINAPSGKGISKTVFGVGVLFALLAGVFIGNLLTVGMLNRPRQTEGVAPEIQREIARWQKETQDKPRNVEAWNNLAFLYHDTHQHELAIRAYEESLKLAPGVPDILVDLGVMYRAVGQPQKAVSCFDQALQKNPAHQIGLLNKGVVLRYDLKDNQGAKAAWQALLRINPKAAMSDGTLVVDLVRQM